MKPWHIDLPQSVVATFLETVDSTNTFLKARANQGAPHLSLVVAKAQTSGRGRGDRSWASFEGNVLWSLLLRPKPHWPKTETLPLVVALAVHDALSEATGATERFKIKWPNDILFEGKKISGSLLEAHSSNRPKAQSEWIVVGIGINVATHPTEELNYQATSLANEGYSDVPRDKTIALLTQHFLKRLDQWIEQGLNSLHDEISARMDMLGKTVSVSNGLVGTEPVIGVFTGLAEDGRMELRTENGKLLVHAGDVFGL